MRLSGQLAEWNDARGFGFIQPDSGGDRLFVHISALQPRPAAQQRLQVGMPLTFVVGVEKGKKRAEAVVWRPRELQQEGRARNVGVATGRSSPQAQQRSSTPRMSKASSHYGILVFFALLWLALATLWGIPTWVWAAYIGLSLWSFAAYAYDKRQAQSGGWRTPESTLHSLAMLGGWPGALLAQQWLRHKSSKASFRTVFWLTVALNMTALVWLVSPLGRAYLPVI